MIATTGDGTDLGRETGTETRADQGGVGTVDAIDPDPATGHLAALEGLVTAATATTTIHDARGTMVVGAPGAMALPSKGMVRYQDS